MNKAFSNIIEILLMEISSGKIKNSNHVDLFLNKYKLSKIDKAIIKNTLIKIL